MIIDLGPNAPPALHRFADALQAEDVERTTVDEPVDPSGVWWLDIRIDGQKHSVAWQRDRGFGLFLNEPVFSENPEAISRDPEMAAARLLQLVAERSSQTSGMPVTLRTLRRLRGRNQSYLANFLNKRQSAISKLENSHDPKLSTLSEYVDAVGGTLVLSVKFADADISLPLTVGSKRPTDTGPASTDNSDDRRGKRRRAA